MTQTLDITSRSTGKYQARRPSDPRCHKQREPRSALGRGRRRGRRRRRHVLLLGAHHRRLLPAVVRGARRRGPRTSRFHATAADARARRLPALQALQARPAAARRAAHAALVAELCRLHRGGRARRRASTTLARRAGLSPLPLPPRLQGGDRRDAEGLRRRASRQARARGARAPSDTVTEAIYDAGFNSSGRFYADVRRRARHDADRVPRRRRRHRRSASRSASARSARSSVAQSERGVCAILLGDDPDALARDLQDRFPQRHADRRRRGVRALVAQGRRLRRGAGASASTCRSTCAAPRSSSASGRRCAQIPAGSTASYAEIAARIGAPEPRRARWRRPAPPTRSRSRSRATASCAATARSPATAGASSASAALLDARRRMSRRRSDARQRDRRRRRGASTGPRVDADLDAHGGAVLDGLLTPSECDALAGALRATTRCSAAAS